MWIPLKGGLELIKKLGGGTEGFKKALKQNRKLFKNTGERTTTKLDNRTGKPVSGSGAKKSKASGPSGSAWDRLSPNIKDQLLKKKGKGMSEKQLAKYRTMYRNRNQ